MTMLLATGHVQPRWRAAAVVLVGLIGIGGGVASGLPASAAGPAIGVEVVPVTVTPPETATTVGVDVTVTNSGDQTVTLAAATVDVVSHVGKAAPAKSGCFADRSLAPGAATTCRIDAARPWVGTVPMTVGVTVAGRSTSGVDVSGRGSAEVGFSLVPGTLDGSITASKSEVESGGSVTFKLWAKVVPPTNRFSQVDYVTTDRFGTPWELGNPNFNDPMDCYPGNHSPYPDDYDCTFTAVLTGKPGEVLTTTMTAKGEGQTITRQVSVRIAGGARTGAQWADPATAWPAVKLGRVAVTRDTRVSSVFSVPRSCRRLASTPLGELLAADAPARGRCAAHTRLARSATAAVLNEAASAEYPAESVSDIRTETSHALRGRVRHMARLTQQYDGWNGESATSGR